MAYEMKDETGSLFRNDKESPNQPDYKGQAKINGVEFWVSGWMKESKNGAKFMSLSFTDKSVKHGSKANTKTEKEDDGDDLPF